MTWDWDQVGHVKRRDAVLSYLKLSRWREMRECPEFDSWTLDMTDVAVCGTNWTRDLSVKLQPFFQGTEGTLTALRGRTERELIIFRFEREFTSPYCVSLHISHFLCPCSLACTTEQYNSRSFTGRTISPKTSNNDEKMQSWNNAGGNWPFRHFSYEAYFLNP